MLCNTIDKLKKYLPTVVSNSFGKYQADVEEANRWLKKEVLGETLYEKAANPDFDNEELFSLCEAVIARKAYLEGIPSYDLLETEGGFIVTRNENQAPASPERVRKLQDQVRVKLTDSIEELLYFLENTTEYKEEWKGSEAYTLLKDTYIPTLTEFRRYAPWDKTRVEWVARKATMKKVIRLCIEPVISRELSDEIINQLREGNLSDSNKLIIENLKSAFASYVIGEEETGQSFINRVRKQLLANPAGFPAFNTSELYKTIRENAIDKYNKERPFFRAGF